MPAQYNRRQPVNARGPDNATTMRQRDSNAPMRRDNDTTTRQYDDEPSPKKCRYIM